MISSPSPQLSILRVFDLIPYVRQKNPEQIIFYSRKGNEWIKYTADQYAELVDFVSSALLHDGIKKGDTLISLTRNRAEFNFLDMGLLQVGAIHVPLYPNVDDEKLEKIILETECKFVFTGSKALYNKVLLYKSKAETSFQLVSFDKFNGAYYFDEFLNSGKENLDREYLSKVKASVETEDTASITYISGATTEAKGVELTHQNQVANILSSTRVMGLLPGMNCISLLPLAHSYERGINYALQYLGVTIWYNENFKNLQHELQEIKPDVLYIVPLIANRLYSNFFLRRSLSSPLRKLFLKAAMKYAENFDSGKSSGKKLIHKIWDLLIYSQWRETAGGKLQILYCGGAALKPQMHNAFHAAGIKIYDGYGLSEAGPLVAFNNPKAHKSFSVGQAIDIATLKIAADGEVLVKSPSVMKGYFKNPAATAEAIDADGWLHTGDKGKIDPEGFLTLTGVKKPIFKLSSGLYADPVTIEQKLIQSELILRAWVFGENQDFLSAILIPDFEALFSWCKMHDVEITGRQDLLSFPAIADLISSDIKKYNETCQRPDRVMKYEFLLEKWSQTTGELHPDGRLNREVLKEKYKGISGRFYSG
jgi:long-chain acyl-CoA synthetase